MARIVQRKSNLMYAYRGEPPVLPVLPEGFECHECTPQSLDRFMADTSDAARRGRYEMFYDRGCLGFMVTTGSEWVGAGWIAPREATGMPPHIPETIGRRENWLFNAHTRQSFRGQGLHKYLVIKRLQFAMTDLSPGENIAVADVRPENKPSRRSYRALGFVEVGRLNTVEVRIPRVKRMLFGRWREQATHPVAAGGTA